MYFLRSIFLLIIFLNISCSQTIQKNGISNVKINKIEVNPGKTSRNYLINKYGPPVFEGIFNKNIMYYVSHVSSYKNLDDRKTLKLVVFEIKLDEKNIVQEVKKYDETDVKNIKISKEKTLDRNDKSVTFFKDIINNISRRNVQN